MGSLRDNATKIVATTNYKTYYNTCANFTVVNAYGAKANREKERGTEREREKNVYLVQLLLFIQVFIKSKNKINGITQLEKLELDLKPHEFEW